MLKSNSLCSLLNIQFPIIQAGMAGQTTAELVSAVSNACGLGILGATRMIPDQLLETIKKIKKNTAKPFGVNLWIGPSIMNNKNQDERSVQQFLNKKIRTSLKIPLKPENLDESQMVKNQNNYQDMTFESKYNEQIKIMLEQNVPVASFAMGDPVKYIDKFHIRGIKVMSMVTNVDDAVTLAKNGSDIIMAQGAEAG